MLNEVTRDALANYYYTVYDQPRYNMCYPDNTEVIKVKLCIQFTLKYVLNNDKYCKS